MINGESYKVVVAEAAKNHLGTENIHEKHRQQGVNHLAGEISEKAD